MTKTILRLAGGLILSLQSIICLGQQQSIFSTILENGLHVIVVENDIVPMSTIVFTVRGSKAAETPEDMGITHLAEHLFFSANESYPTQEKFMERSRELGLTVGPIFGGMVLDESVIYWCKISKDAMAAALQFIQASVVTPRFNEDDLEREKQVVVNEIDLKETYPYMHLQIEMAKKLWPTGYSRKNTGGGDRATVLSADENKVRTMRERYYIPNNSAILVAGDVEHQYVFSLVKQIFGNWKRGRDPFIIYPIPDQPPLIHSDSVILEKPVNAVTLWLRWHGPSLSRDEKSTYAADVLAYVLAQRNSKLNMRLVGSGMCSWIWVSNQTLNFAGPIIINTEMSVDHYHEAERAIFEELQKLTDPDYYSDEQIETAKHLIEIDRLYSQESPSSFIILLGESWALAGNLDYYLHYMDNVQKITRADIDGYVVKYLFVRRQAVSDLRADFLSYGFRPS